MSDNEDSSPEENNFRGRTKDNDEEMSDGDNVDNAQINKNEDNKDDQSEDEYDENINYDQSGMEDNDMDEDPSTFINSNDDKTGSRANNKTSDRVKMSDIFGSDNEESSNDERVSHREKSRSKNEVHEENVSNSDDEDNFQDSAERVSESAHVGRLKDSPPDGDLNSDYEAPKHDGSDGENDSKSPPSANTHQQPPLQEILIEAEMPRVRPDMLISASVPGKKDQIAPDPGQQQNEIHFVKLPNFLSVEPKAFNPTTYEDEIDEDEIYDEEGRTRIKLRVENTVRWRFKPEPRGSGGDNNGLENKESNSKIIRWSDGSMSLQVGSEYFDVYKSVILNDFNHLFVRQGTGLQGQAVFKTKLSFRPHSTNSITHRKMTLSLANRCSKAQKIKVLASVGADPETGKAEIYKKEEEKFRASIRRDNQKRRVREKMAGQYSKHSTSKANIGSDVSFSDNEDEDRNTNSIAAIKNSYKKGFSSGDFGHRGASLDVLPPPYVTSSNKFGARSGHAGPPVKESRPKIYSSDSDEDGNYESRNDSEKRSKKTVKVISVSDDDE